MARTRTGVVALSVAVALWLAAVPVHAQDPAAPSVPRADQDAGPQVVNVRVSLTIAQEVEGGKPDTRNVMMVLADGLPGRVRAGASPRPGAPGAVPTELNVDATARIMGGGRVRVQLIVEHMPVPQTRSDAPPTHTATHLNESITVYLDSGVPLVVSEAADPITGLRTTVEVTATVLK